MDGSGAHKSGQLSLVDFAEAPESTVAPGRAQVLDGVFTALRGPSAAMMSEVSLYYQPNGATELYAQAQGKAFKDHMRRTNIKNQQVAYVS